MVAVLTTASDKISINIVKKNQIVPKLCIEHILGRKMYGLMV